jgi:transcriptional regulator with XRE-family HTH domain
MHIGYKIKAEITDRGIQVTDFARRIHRNRTYIYSIFEKENIDTKLLIQIAETLKIPVSSFFNDTNVHQTTTSNNIYAGRDNNLNLSLITDCQGKLEKALFEIEHLKALLEEKERTIQILMNK